MNSTESIMDTPIGQRNLRMKKMVVVMPAIGEDLIMEILLHLPPVSVLKFKSVSKSWYSLITNPSFLSNHAAQFHLSHRNRRCLRLPDPPGLLLSTYPPCLKHSFYAILDQDQESAAVATPLLNKACLDQSLPALKKYSDSSSTLVDSCNGLLLYYAQPRIIYSDLPIIHNSITNQHTKVPLNSEPPIILNPITNQHTQVPLKKLFQTFFKPEKFKTTFVCDSPHILFDPSISLSYKILTCLNCLETLDPHCELYVYSSDTCSWKFLKRFAEKDGLSQKTFMFDGVFYWLRQNDLICFDFVKESVSFLPLPPIPKGYQSNKVHYFGECGGRLRLIEDYLSPHGNYMGGTFPFRFDIMEMEPGSMIWSVKTRVNIEAGYEHLIQKKRKLFPHGVTEVIHLYETEKGEEAVLLNVDFERLVLFNITTNTFGKKITIPYFKNYYCLNAFPFTPTLFPLLTS